LTENKSDKKTRNSHPVPEKREPRATITGQDHKISFRGRHRKPPVEAPKINVRWFKEQMAKNGLTGRQVAKLMDLNHSIISHMFKGRRKMRLDEAAVWAKILKVPISDVLTNAGVDISGEGVEVVSAIKLKDGHPVAQPRVPVKGTVDSEMRVLWNVVIGPASSLNPFPGEQGVGIACLRCQTAGGPFDGWDGALLYYKELAPGSFDYDSVGRFCLVKTMQGEHLLRIVKRGYEPGKHNLALFNGVAREQGVIIEEATPILWIKM
jgi:transcriptional regulator with XRE-family HTH domain